MFLFTRTYHKVELRAGPNVNLILGPNGTGKSTIVCAICIGLAGKPKILGRASSLKEYIRHECNSCSIETELYNPDGDNYVVRRYIRVSNASANSTWSLNGKKVSQGNVRIIIYLFLARPEGL
jgi:chromosome segregation ATPase